MTTTREAIKAARSIIALIVAIISSLTITAQPDLIQGTIIVAGSEDEYRSKIRIDTIYGRVFYDNDGVPTIFDGMRIDSIESTYRQVPCPDEEAGTYWGCAALHYGWRDKRLGYRYYIFVIERTILNKQVIHFTPE